MSSRALAAVAFAVSGCASAPQAPAIAAELAAAETAFAAQSVREGMRAAFLAWLAPDATLFRPGPVNGPAAIAAKPDPPIVLDWRPVFVEVAASGEMGLSTGPWRLTSRGDPAAAPRFGQFVSIWTRSAAGDWRVQVDLGIAHPQPALADAPLQAGVTPAAGDPGSAGSLAAAETQFARAAATEGNAAAYAQWLSPSARLYRDGHAPFVGREAVLSSATFGAEATTWTGERVASSGSGDFGYALGGYGPVGGAAAGHYLRVWRREAAGWRIALDVVNPLPR